MHIYAPLPLFEFNLKGEQMVDSSLCKFYHQSVTIIR